MPHTPSWAEGAAARRAPWPLAQRRPWTLAALLLILCWPVPLHHRPVGEDETSVHPGPLPTPADMFGARHDRTPTGRPTAWRYHPVPVEQITQALIATGSPADSARGVAPLVRHWAKRRDVSPLLITSVLAIENPRLNSTARSSAGARGLMQVMPLHWRDGHPCGASLTSPSANLCLGTAILSEGLARSMTLRGALLRYNGCKRTPGCDRYATRVALAYGRQHAELTPKPTTRVASR
jgi:hypothetical protein